MMLTPSLAVWRSDGKLEFRDGEWTSLRASEGPGNTYVMGPIYIIDPTVFME